MEDYRKYIGKNMKEVRAEKGLTQKDVSERCGISDSTLSAYENSRKYPSLYTLFSIAKALEVSVERLYYGDENSSFVNSEPDNGKKIVNALSFLWEIGMIDTCITSNGENCIQVKEYYNSVIRLIKFLRDYDENKNTYPNPDSFRKDFLTSVSNEINNSFEKVKK